LWVAACALALSIAPLPAAADGAATGDELGVTRFMVFVPAKDFALSKRFYLALGSELVDEGADFAEFRWADDRFIVTNEYQAAWAENFKVHVIVKDAAAFARRASELAASGDFPGVRVEGPKEEPWGYRVTYVRDPSGVSLRFSEPIKR
jgi:catechol 2,3-dioxygenase-like lactoylglutathione lyase family enzyme